jgi:hypothetical protein
LCYLDKNEKGEVPYVFYLDSLSGTHKNEGEDMIKFLKLLNEKYSANFQKNIINPTKTAVLDFKVLYRIVLHSNKYKVTSQQGLDCAYASVTNVLTLINSGVVRWMMNESVGKLINQDSVCLFTR